MTIEEAKAALVAWCNSQVGYHEGADNFNKYADVEGISRLYGWNPQHQPWCDVFADAAFICCFGYDLASAMTYQPTGAGSAACSMSAAYYKQHGAWYTSPEVGDQIFFYVGNAINHTGIVTRVGIGAITTVEGNSSDSVQMRQYDLNSYQIAGYGRPKWEVVEHLDELPTAPVEPETPVEKPKKVITVTLDLNELTVGDTGTQVKFAQTLLEARGFTCGWYGIDGDFGRGTQQAVCNFQITQKLEVDGIIGQQTWDALLAMNW